MMNILFPGRHHLLTSFQLEYLTSTIEGDQGSLVDVNGKPLGISDSIDTVIWAVTSANHSGTRRNPLPLNRREVAIERFAEQLAGQSFVYGIDDMGSTKRFAEYVIKKIEVDSNGQHVLTPENTIVACSTPQVITMYEALGFRILPVELANRITETYCATRPWEFVEQIVEIAAQGGDSSKDESILRGVAKASRNLFSKYGYWQKIAHLFADPLLGSDGDLTATRDYNTYVKSFDEGADRKYALIKDLVVPGRIVDIGCCTGSVIKTLADDPIYAESDFYGIEVVRRLYDECVHRKANGYFGDRNVFFYQRNAAENKVFHDNSVNTFTTFSLTHEIESYQGRETLERFIELLHDQLAIGGSWINVDVVGPENKDEVVYMWLNDSDGNNDDIGKMHPLELSTFSRFLRFAEDFRKSEDYKVGYGVEEVELDGRRERMIKLRMQDAYEFITKKDYTDNWESEMHETFGFFNFNDWQEAARKAGFTVSSQSHTFANPWIVKNRWQGHVRFYSAADLSEISYPATTMVLVGAKR